MSILATDKKLISFGTDYSAGSGISIIDHTISIVPSAVGKTYSAGPNIDIYDVSGQPTISSKDWSNEISSASAGAVTQSTSYFNEWINGQYTGDITNITNNLTALSGDLSSYYKKTETSSKEQISDAIQYVSAHAVGDVEVNNYVHNNSATIDEVNSAYKANSASYITAHQSLEGYATEDWVTAQGYITGVNIPESATWNETSTTVQTNSAKWSEGKTYEGVSPIVVNNDESKISADTWTLSAGDGISFTDNSANKVTRIDVTAQGGDEGVNSFVHDNSATIIDVNSSYQSNSATWNEVSQAYEQASATYLTSISIPESAVWQDVSTTVQSNSSQWNQGCAGDAEVNNYVYNNSAAIDETVTTYEQNSASYLTEVPTGYAVESAFEKNVEDKITSYNGTAFFACVEGGGDMFTSYLEYNDQNQISGYNGSAFAGETLTGDAQGAVDIVYSTSGNIITGTKSEHNFTARNVNKVTFGNFTIDGLRKYIEYDCPGYPTDRWLINNQGFYLGPEFADGYWEKYARVWLERTGLSSMSGTKSDKKLIWRALLDTDVEGTNNTITAEITTLLDFFIHTTSLIYYIK